MSDAFKEVTGPSAVSSDKSDFQEQYEFRIKSLINDSIDFNDSELSPYRVENTKYYEGEYPLLEADESQDGQESQDDVNRSQAVSTDVRDTVKQILPSLIRIFTSNENVVNFVPRNKQGVEAAKRQTDYVNYVFNEDNEGFMLLHNVFKDMLINKIGIMKWWTEEAESEEHKTFHRVTIEQLTVAIQEYVEKTGDETKIEVIEVKPSKTTPELLDSVTVKFVKTWPEHKIEAVPPEEFRVSRVAKTARSAPLIGQQTFKSISYLMSRGHKREVLEEYAGAETRYYTEEASLRNPAIDEAVSMERMVAFGEYYVWADSDDDGKDELHHIHVVGSDNHIIFDEIVEYVDLAVFCPDPRPHTVVGDCPADDVKDIQNIKTKLLRGALDNISSSMFPDTYIDQMRVNMEDALDDSVGKMVRVNGDPNTAVREYRTTFAGEQIFGMMGTMDTIRVSRTGISEASKGVDPKALQSTNVMGIDAIVSGAQERIELIARIIAETGFKDLFRGLMREISKYPTNKREVMIRDNFVDIDPSVFDPNLTVRVNPTLGRGTDIVQMQALQMVKDTQTAIISQFGPGNTIVTPRHFMNTITDMLAIVNIKDTSRYFGEITDELIESLQTAPKEPGPDELIARAQLEDVKAKTARAVADSALKREKQDMDEDFRRDKLELDSIVSLIQAFAKSADDEKDASMAYNIERRGNTRNA